MKRDPALVPLGHDHHQALEAALRMRRATADDLDAAIARLQEFWSAQERELLEARLEPDEMSRLGRDIQLAESRP